MVKAVPMGPYLWCALGAVLGFAASRMVQPQGFTPMVESMGVGVFGAFVGGEFLSSVVLVSPPGGPGITAASVAMGVAGAVVCLLLLALMRHAVGPMKAHKKRKPT